MRLVLFGVNNWMDMTPELWVVLSAQMPLNHINELLNTHFSDGVDLLDVYVPDTSYNDVWFEWL